MNFGGKAANMSNTDSSAWQGAGTGSHKADERHAGKVML